MRVGVCCEAFFRLEPKSPGGKAMRICSDKGFTLVELMITLAILSVLAVMEVPIFEAFQIRAKQAEAKANA